jgi:hypothetical protein
MGIVTRKTYTELSNNNNNNNEPEKKEKKKKEQVSGRGKPSRLHNCELMSMLVRNGLMENGNSTPVSIIESSYTVKPL